MPSQRKGVVLQMMASTYLRSWQQQARRWAVRPGVQVGGKGALCVSCGVLFSGAALGGVAQPLVMGVAGSLRGWWAALTCLGAAAGYPLFWGKAGIQGVVWAGLGLLLSFLPERLRQEQPLLPGALAAFFTAAVGLGFQIIYKEALSFPLYLLRVGTAAGATGLFTALRIRQDPFLYALGAGVGVLAVARVGPGFLKLGYVAAGMLGAAGPLTWGAMAGLGLDLGGGVPISMTGALCLGCFLRLVPVSFRWYRWLTPALGWGILTALTGEVYLQPLPGLLLGGLTASLLPPRPDVTYRRGETGVVQVRLELTAEVMGTMQRLLLQTREPEIDREALVTQVRRRACGGCSARGSCREQERLSPMHLEEPGTFLCRKPGKIQGELRRGQEQLRRICGDRHRRAEYRSALTQQYQFLGRYLRSLSDQLPRRGDRPRARYRVEVSARSKKKEWANGDRCLAFPGAGCRYYVLLSDGMGTGLGAAETGEEAAGLIRQMLSAGFPAEYALRSLNSILTLRGQAGAAALDLAEIRLDAGKITLYKWGAAPSYVLKRTGAEKIGTATPPPGIRVEDTREAVVRLSLHRGEALILVSDGAEIGECLRRIGAGSERTPGELAQKLLEESFCGEDDATVAVIRLLHLEPS